MAETASGPFLTDPRNTWIRLRTLVNLRWVAVAGQVLALFVAHYGFGLAFHTGLFAMVIGLSVIANVIVTFIYPPNTRLVAREAAAMLLFDTMQIGALLFLSGGLHNPFSVLIVAPVTVAATALSLRATITLGVVAALLVSAAAVIHVPLRTTGGEMLRMPPIFLFGLWVAEVVTIAFLAVYNRRVATEMRAMSQALLATQMALAREQKLTDLGGVVAAAAHELGTPLATITLAASELAEELEDQGALSEDAELIREQADRCRDILRSMGKAGKEDLHMRQAPLSAVVESAAEPHSDRGKVVTITVGNEGDDQATQPIIQRRPEIVHGLRNLIQNAVDFASSHVWVNICWSEDDMSVRITDDGAGYPPHVIGELGEPFLGRRRRRQKDRLRPNYDGMGLGLFIAKTLLERTGAEISFFNASEPWTGQAQPGKKSGAIVLVTWPRGKDSIEAAEKTPVLGQNLRIPD